MGKSPDCAMIFPPCCRLLLPLLLLSPCLPGQAATTVWWEGEKTVETNIASPLDMRTPGHLNAEQQGKLSEGRWLTVGKTTDGKPAMARYRVSVPAAGPYQLYVRKFWKHGPFKWRFGGQDWQACGRDIALLDNTFLQQHWGANWVKLGEVELAKGEQDFELEFLENKGCIDCFLLTDGPFSPRGKLKPGAKTGDAMPGHFAWEPEPDPLDGSSPIDLSALNEDEAGASGFVRREGDGFRLGSGKPVRFWMVQANLRNFDRPDIDRWAKRLRKYGVNLVRLQFSDFFKLHVQGDKQGFARELDKLHYVVAALKKQGIYTYFGHLYWHSHNDLPKGLIPGFEGGKGIGLPFVAGEYEALFRDYTRALFTPRNPYTGKSLADEPAVAFVEINNESSLLFWTFNPAGFGEAERALLEKDFGEFCHRKYGSLDKALEAWGPKRAHTTPGDPARGRMGLYGAGHLTGADWAVGQRNLKRAADQMQWMVEGMRDYYSRLQIVLKRELGVGSLVTASNWKSADDRISGGLERHSYTVTDAVLRNAYFSTRYPKGGAQKFYAVELGDTFSSVSSLKEPMMPGPLATPQIQGHPFLVTENSWTRPNRFRAEWPVLVASYASLTGVDGWCFFALDAAEWQVPMAVWDLNNPTILGQFPACALMYRRGDVQPAARAAVHETLGLADAYALKGSRIHAVSGEDALWRAAIGEREGSGTVARDSIDPRAFFVGPVRHEFHDGPSSVKTADLKDFIDSKAGTITSLTRQLQWNYREGVLRINTPRAQGATGFLGAAGPIRLSDVQIESANEYGSILVVSLDGQPIAKSGKLLVQVATEDLPYGFATRPAGEHRRITELGGYPLNVKRVQARLEVRGRVRKALVLDGNGLPDGRKAVSGASGKGVSILLPEDAIYTLLR